MRLGVCQVPYQARGWLQPVPTPASWQALRDVGVTDLRLQFDLSAVSPEPGLWDTRTFEKWLRPARDAGLRVCGNIVMGAQIAAGVAPPAHHDAAFREEAGRRFVDEFVDMLDSYGLGNEPGFGPWMDDDISRGGPRDYVRDDYFPNFIIPVSRGIRSVNGDANVSGFEADGAEIQLRCLDAAKDFGVRIDTESVHPYGDVGGGDYATMALFDEIYRRDPSRARLIGEIDHQQLPGAKAVATDAQIAALKGFAQSVAEKYPDIEVVYFGTPEYFFTRKSPGGLLANVTWSTWTFGQPEVSQPGASLAEVFQREED